MLTWQSRKKEFIKTLKQAGHRHDLWRLWEDWLELSFCALAKAASHPSEADRYEDRYMAVVDRYREPDHLDIIRDTMPKLLGMVGVALTVHEGDFLGEIAGEMEVLNSHLGQFFTPFSVSRLMAEINHGESIVPFIQDKGYISVQEPACGSGGMILAMASVIKQKGYKPNEAMIFHAQDLSPTAFKMCYIQTSCAGLSGIVHLGDTLRMETQDSVATMGYLMRRIKDENWRPTRQRARA